MSASSSSASLKEISLSPESDGDPKMKELSDLYSTLQSGYDISRQEIARAKKEGRFGEIEGLGYGEVDVEAFANFLRSLPPYHNKGRFVDFGSGSGKAVLAAAFSGLFSSCIGVEIVEPLQRLALQAKERASLIDPERASCVHFELGDIFEKEELWQTADILFITCTLFTDDMMQRLDMAINTLVQSGSIVITTTRRLMSSRARVLSEMRVKYAKGSLLFIVYFIV